MIEPTESEDKAELDRFCDAMIAIYQEIQDIVAGKMDKVDNPLKNAPHTQVIITADEWNHSYGREKAAFPLPYTRTNKFWPSIGRVNNTLETDIWFAPANRFPVMKWKLQVDWSLRHIK